MVKDIEVGCERVLQRPHVFLRVKHSPGLLTCFSFARFEHHHQGIESFGDVLKGSTCDLVVLGRSLLVEQIVDLAYSI